MSSSEATDSSKAPVAKEEEEGKEKQRASDCEPFPPAMHSMLGEMPNQKPKMARLDFLLRKENRIGSRDSQGVIQRETHQKYAF